MMLLRYHPARKVSPPPLALRMKSGYPLALQRMKVRGSKIIDLTIVLFGSYPRRAKGNRLLEKHGLLPSVSVTSLGSGDREPIIGEKRGEIGE